MTNCRILHNIYLYSKNRKKAENEKSSIPEAVREGLSSAENSLKGRACEVHSGADSANTQRMSVAGYVSHTLRAMSERTRFF